MKLTEFDEQNLVIAKDQPEYQPLPCHKIKDDPQGEIIFCWKLSWKERVTLLFSGRLWHHVLTFNQSLQPQFLQVYTPAGLPRKEEKEL